MKLVRDNVPVLYPQNEYQPVTHRELTAMLRLKLIEEAGEVVGARNLSELIEELGDVLDVVAEIAHSSGINPEIIESARAAKSARLGGFGDGWVMTTYEEKR